MAWAYLAAVLLGLVQALVLGEPGRTLGATVPYLLALAVVLGVGAAGPRDEMALRRWLAALTVAGGVLAVWLLAGLLPALAEAAGEPHAFYRVKVQVTSPVGDHNTAAGLLLPAMTAGAVATARDRRWAVGLALITLGLVATLSRGAVVVLLVVAAAALALASDRRFKVALLTSALAAAGLLGLLLLALDPAPAEVTTEADGALGPSVVARVDLAERGAELGLEQPALGVGIGAFASRADDLPPPNDHAHQLLAHAAAEGGVVLLLVALAVPLVLLIRVLRLGPGPGRDALLFGGGALVAHAQLEILGGRVGYEVLLALLATLAGMLGPAPDRQRSE